MVGPFDHVHIMLDDHDRMSLGDQGVEGLEQGLDVVEMKSGRRLVEYENRRLLFLVAEEVSQFYPLVLYPGKRR